MQAVLGLVEDDTSGQAEHFAGNFETLYAMARDSSAGAQHDDQLPDGWDRRHECGRAAVLRLPAARFYLNYVRDFRLPDVQFLHGRNSLN